METTLPLKVTSIAEKLRAMEALWADLSRMRRNSSRLRGMATSCVTGSENEVGQGNVHGLGSLQKAVARYADMKILILPSGRDDLAEGFRLRTAKRISVDIFWIRFSLILIRCDCMSGFIRKFPTTIGCCQNAFLTPFTLLNSPERFSSKLFWIVAAILNSIAKGCGE